MKTYKGTEESKEKLRAELALLQSDAYYRTHENINALAMSNFRAIAILPDTVNFRCASRMHKILIKYLLNADSRRYSMLSQYYYTEKFLFNGSDNLFVTCWHHVTRAYIARHALPLCQADLHNAITDIANRLQASSF